MPPLALKGDEHLEHAAEFDIDVIAQHGQLAPRDRQWIVAPPALQQFEEAGAQFGVDLLAEPIEASAGVGQGGHDAPSVEPS